jgi:hypothetical protein
MKKKKLKFPQKFVFLTPSEYRSLSHEGRLRYIAAIARQLQQIRAVVKASSKSRAEPLDVYGDEVRPPTNKRAHP